MTEKKEFVVRRFQSGTEMAMFLADENNFTDLSRDYPGGKSRMDVKNKCILMQMEPKVKKEVNDESTRKKSS